MPVAFAKTARAAKAQRCSATTLAEIRSPLLAAPASYAASHLEAIKIASFNGVRFLGEDARIGSIAVGKQADLMVVRGNPALNISEIEKVEIVFKDGVGYDSEKLIQSVQGLVEIR